MAAASAPSSPPTRGSPSPFRFAKILVRSFVRAFAQVRSLRVTSPFESGATPRATHTETTMKSPAHSVTPRPFRCSGCGFLLGMHHGAELHIKFKDLAAVIAGGVFRTHCRRCHRLNETGSAQTTPPAP